VCGDLRRIKKIIAGKHIDIDMLFFVHAATVAAFTTTSAARPPPQLQLLTFDLDDTLFPCGRVVQRANAKLSSRLRELGAAPPDNFQDAIREVRRAHAAADGEPLTYSELRCRAIADLLGSASSPALIEECFDTWLDARQAEADALLFDHVVEALTAVRQQHPQCIVGAVTNGRGDPRGMPRLEGLFDFCVSGEDADVWPDRKPSPEIYEHALRRASSSSGGGAIPAASPQSDVSQLRSSWVHVGDCLVNDVEASKRAGATTIWYDVPHDPLATFSTASPEEEERRRVARAKALEAGYVDCRIEAMSALPSELDRLVHSSRSSDTGVVA
jgi:FMN phosphatase YigB (HAD superfamily)